MTLRKTLNFDHLPVDVVTIASNNTGLPFPYPQLANAPTSNLNIGTPYDECKWLGSNAACFIVIPLQQVFGDLTKKSIMGYRVTMGDVNQFRIGAGMFSQAAAGFLVGEVLAATVNGGTLGGPNLVNGKEHYIEIVWDWVAYTTLVRVDGQDKWSRTYTQAQMASMLTSYMYILIGYYQSATPWWTKDWYFQDAVGSEVIAPFGPAFTRPGKGGVFTAPQFFPSSGYNISSALSQKVLDNGLMGGWPNIQSNDISAGGDVTQSGVAIDYGNGTILGVELWASARDFGTVPRSLTPRITNGTTMVGATKAMTLAQQNGSFNLGAVLTPGGAAWSNANLAATSFVHRAS